MPIYEYLCEKCEHEFEREQRITDDPVKTCPECRSRRVKKLISQTSFVLKGGGWYADGYGDKKSSTDDAKDAKPDASGDATKDDAKPDAKKDAKPDGKKDAKAGKKKTASKPAAKKGKSAA